MAEFGEIASTSLTHYGTQMSNYRTQPFVVGDIDEHPLVETLVGTSWKILPPYPFHST